MTRKLILGDDDEPSNDETASKTTSEGPADVTPGDQVAPNDDAPARAKPMTKGAPGWGLKPQVFVDRTKKRKP